jgi:hypothetical protein
MDIVEIASLLQKEAQNLLSTEILWNSLLSCGNVHLAGSTYLDLLIFPDLDVYYEPTNENVIPLFARVASELINIKDVMSIELEKEMYKRYKVPKGVCLQYRFNNGEHLWKVDIWALEDKNILLEKMEETKLFKNKLTEKKRALILQTKHKLAAPFGRTPIGSSYLVYKAVLEENLDSVESIIAYIRQKGGNVDKLK